MKRLTRKQVQGRKEKAVRFVEDLLGDPDRADEIADESLEHYAARRRIEIINPKGRKLMATKQQLEHQIRDLEDENQDLQERLDEILDIVAPEEEEEEEGEELGE